MTPFQDAVNDFYTLGDRLTYTINKAEWWLLKYSDLYAEHKRDLPYIEDFEFAHEKGVTEFMEIYQALLLITEVAKLDSTFSGILDDYKAEEADKEKRILWAQTNMALFEKYQYDVFRESEDSISANYGYGKNFIVRGDEFRNLARFLEVMEEMIYEV